MHSTTGWPRIRSTVRAVWTSRVSRHATPGWSSNRSAALVSGQPPQASGTLPVEIHLAVDAHGLPGRALVTQGPAADCTPASRRIEGINADHLFADQGYDPDAILGMARTRGMNAVIPPKKNRTVQRSYDKELYKLRHLVENAFPRLKRWRGIATHYAKNTPSFLASTSAVSHPGSISPDYP